MEGADAPGRTMQASPAAGRVPPCDWTAFKHRPRGISPRWVTKFRDFGVWTQGSCALSLSGSPAGASPSAAREENSHGVGDQPGEKRLRDVLPHNTLGPGVERVNHFGDPAAGPADRHPARSSARSFGERRRERDSGHPDFRFCERSRIEAKAVRAHDADHRGPRTARAALKFRG